MREAYPEVAFDLLREHVRHRELAEDRRPGHLAQLLAALIGQALLLLRRHGPPALAGVVDQGLSLTLFFKDTATTRDINRAQIYAWKKKIKTIYYIRLRQLALEGTEIDGCVSCML